MGRSTTGGERRVRLDRQNGHKQDSHNKMKEGINKQSKKKQMKRPALLLGCFAVLGAMCFPAGNTQAAAEGKKVIGYYMDASDDYYKAGFQVFKALATKSGWEVLDVVGQGTAPEQVSAVENFITQKVDALVVVQNSPQTTSECH